MPITLDELVFNGRAVIQMYTLCPGTLQEVSRSCQAEESGRPGKITAEWTNVGHTKGWDTYSQNFLKAAFSCRQVWPMNQNYCAFKHEADHKTITGFKIAEYTHYSHSFVLPESYYLIYRSFKNQIAL